MCGAGLEVIVGESALGAEGSAAIHKHIGKSGDGGSVEEETRPDQRDACTVWMNSAGRRIVTPPSDLPKNGPKHFLSPVMR